MKLRNNPLLQELISTSVSPAFNFFVRKHWSYHFASSEIQPTESRFVFFFFLVSRGFPVYSSKLRKTFSQYHLTSQRLYVATAKQRLSFLYEHFLRFGQKGVKSNHVGGSERCRWQDKKYFSAQLKQRLKQTRKYVFL